VTRDPQRPARLLRAEHDALLPILHRTPERAFERPTACPGWSVRDVLAHCAAALTTRRCAVPLVEVGLPGGTLRLGVPEPGRPQATLVTDGATLMRLFAGWPAEPSHYRLTGATAEELVVF